MTSDSFINKLWYYVPLYKFYFTSSSKQLFCIEYIHIHKSADDT